MSAYLDQLEGRKAEVVHRMRQILDTAAEEKRELSTEENTNLETIDTDLARFDAEKRRIEEMESRAVIDDKERRALEPVVGARAKDERGDQTDIQKLAGLFTSIRSYGAAGAFDSGIRPEFRALQSAGGSAIPETFIERVTVYARTLTPMFNDSVVTMLNTTSGNPIVLPRLTADPSHGGTVTAEAAGILEADPTVSSVQLDAYKYAITTLWSAELDQDEVIGLEDLIARSVARELSIDIGAHLTTGDGSGKPNGFINAASNGGTASGTANNTFFGPDDLIDLFFGLAAPYRQNGTWQASSTGVAKIRKLKNADGDYMWVQGLAGAPDTVLGRPIYENPAMAAVASASKSVAFGDFSRYHVRRVTPVRVELSRDYKFSTDQLALKTVERVDGDLVDAAGIAYLVSANA